MTNSIFDKAISQTYSGKTMWIFPSAFILIILIGYFLDLEKSTQGLLVLCALLTSHIYKTHLALANAVALLSNSISNNRESLLKEIKNKYDWIAKEKFALQARVDQLDDRLSSFLIMEKLKEDLQKSSLNQ